MNTCFVLSKGVLPVVLDSVFVAVHTIDGRSVALLHLGRNDDLPSCPRAIEKGRELEMIFAIFVTGLCGQHEGEFGTTDRFHVAQGSLCILAFGVVFVESVAVDVDRNAHIWQAVCAHGGGGVFVA
jgi:hypothetical protein